MSLAEVEHDAPANQPVGLKLRQTFSSLPEVDLGTYPDGIFHLDRVGAPSLKWYFRRSSERRLYVMLHAAIKRKEVPVPVFARWNWTRIIPGHMICVYDPTMDLSSTLSYGWYLGTERHDATAMVAELVKKIAANLGVNNQDIVFYGSSGGGFAALMCAGHLEGSTCLVMNSMVNIFMYPRPALLSIFAPGQSKEQILRKYSRRFSIYKRFPSADDLPVTFVAQNVIDRYRHANYDQFCKTYGVPLEGGATSNGRIISSLYEAPLGHHSFPANVVRSTIQQHLELIASVR